MDNFKKRLGMKFACQGLLCPKKSLFLVFHFLQTHPTPCNLNLGPEKPGFLFKGSHFHKPLEIEALDVTNKFQF